MAALLRSRGTTLCEETMFSARYRHVDELRRMGAQIRTAGAVAIVSGVNALHGARVQCTDLRGGAALCVAGVAAEGESRIERIRHIDRGYESIERDLRALGAQIERIANDETGDGICRDADATQGDTNGEASASSISCCPSC
ncbi:MAG: hypothetical protein IKN53_04025, partial [Oscillibacter sp.]|nr:hypothetical protein [Oscillibacter sp.]